MKKQKTSSHRSARRKSKFPVKLIIITALVFLAVIFILGFAREALKKAAYFKVADIIASEENDIDISSFKGRNMLTLDLKKEAERLSKLYPVYKKISLVRILPNRIYVDFVKRNTVAYVKLEKYFSIDENSVLFDTEGEEGKSGYLPDDGLPVILGLEKKISRPILGTKYSYKELKLALEIIRELSLKNIPRDYQIRIVDVNRPENASIIMDFFLDRSNFSRDRGERNAFEVIVGQENIAYRIGLLASFLDQIDKSQDNIEYIDLRFKEPVIKLRHK